MQKLQPLSDQFNSHKSGTGDVTSRATQTSDETGTHGVGGCGEDYWRGRCRGHRGSDRDVARTGADNCNFALNQVACHGGGTIKLAFGPTVFDPNILAFDEAPFVLAPMESNHAVGPLRCPHTLQHTDHRHFRLSSPRRK